MRKFTGVLVAVLVVTSLAMAPATALAIGKYRAHVNTDHYARHECKRDRWCRGWDATSPRACTRTSNGVICTAYNYEKHHGKYTCKRSIRWKSANDGVLLTPWHCGTPGWQSAP